MKFLTVLLVCAVVAPTAATELISSEKLQSHIITQKLQSNLWHLSQIARKNGGNRAFGLPGYKASVDFIHERVSRFSPIVTYKQEFTAWFTQTLNISLLIDQVPISVVSFSGTVSTPGSKALKAPLALIPQNGCVPEDYAGVNATEKIVLVKRGICTFGSKVALAKAQGAAAALIWNNVPGTVLGGTLGKGDFVAAGMISLEEGIKLVRRLEEGEVVEAEFLVDAIGEQRKTWNFIAETKDGDPKNVIVLGAHLDSVQAGAGINDDGSGTSALLEIIEAVKHYRVNNKVRFIWWGAEENGLLGSYHYTDTLPASEVENLGMYLNFDMIGSKNAFYGVFDGDGSTYGFFPAPGSGHIEKMFADYLRSLGKIVQPAAFSNGSDYVGFVDLGVPVGGLFTGTTPQDMCYHLKCDDFDNINWEVLTLNTKAIAHVVAGYAVSLEGIPAKLTRRKRGLIRRKRSTDAHAHAHEEGSLCGGHDEL